MKILIITDIEGVSCIDSNCKSILTGSSEWENHGRHMLTRDVKQALEVCLVFGAKKVEICDCHDQGNSIIRNEFSNYKGVSFIEKDTLSEISEKDYDAALLIGFHAMNGSRGFYPHTYRSDIDCIEFNGNEIGEVGIISYFLNELKIPLIMISGDDITVEEAKKLNNQIEGAVVKRVREQENLILTRKEADREITKALEKAFLKLHSFEFEKNTEGFYVEVISKDQEFIDDLMNRDIGVDFKITDIKIAWFSPIVSDAMIKIEYLLNIFCRQSTIRYSKNYKFQQELLDCNLYDKNEKFKKFVNDLENSYLLYTMTLKDRLQIKEAVQAFKE